MLFIFSGSNAAWCRRHFKTLDQGWQTYWKGKHSLAPGIHCCPSFFIAFALPASLYFEEYLHIYAYMHICNREQTVYELPLLPNNTAVKHFYTNRERCEMLTGYLSLEPRPCDDWPNTWHIFVFDTSVPQWARTISITRFLDHTGLTTVGKTPLDEWSARRRDLNLTTYNTHSRQTSMLPVGLESTISAGERPQTYALDRSATGRNMWHWTKYFTANQEVVASAVT